MDGGMNVLDRAHRPERSHDGQFDDGKASDGGKAKITGNTQKLGEFVSWLDNFEFWFNIVTLQLSL